ncbi:DUF4260 domain-containing protein [Chitinibacter fontanus]|uniref:DUF4260 domain-containing protein n=1 Tax=Chitinibacter fontanus TaxID=1737446 RepID=A0A7D5V9R7_9NEIS|nr:DUF4260 domain-containing protein [Chitinibacter fontanus]QLI80933.1 DUF4260 domain-containing protein [Chitinibacter fontanus]
MANTAGSAQGGVRLILRLEGLCILLAALALYSAMRGDWWQFAGWFFVPDLALLGYWLNRQCGAVCYNLSHSYVGALLVCAYGHFVVQPYWLSLGLIWCAHLGFDRALGYGLKYAAGFHFTHLGHIGRRKAQLD